MSCHVTVFNRAGLWLQSISHQYQPPPPLLFWSLLTGMCEPAVRVLRGKVHISAHGSTDKIITMVTTGCGLSLGTLGESHTDTNSPKGTHINTVKANIHTETFTHSYGGAGTSQGYIMWFSKTKHTEMRSWEGEGIYHPHISESFIYVHILTGSRRT